jgi:hypothetical protein
MTTNPCPGQKKSSAYSPERMVFAREDANKWEGTGRTQLKQQKLKCEQEDANHSMPLHWRQGGGVCVEMSATACLHANTFPQCS